MTRKDYKLIAAALATVRPKNYSVYFDTWLECRNAIIFTLSEENPRFSIERFTEACQKGGDG